MRQGRDDSRDAGPAVKVDYRYCPACGSPLGERTIEGRPRPACPSCDFVAWRGPQLAVALLATDARGRVLLIRRGPGVGEGGWALPGGFVDGAEGPAEAAARECREEVGCEVEVGELQGAFPVSTGDGPLVVLGYAGRLRSGQPEVSAEATEVGWFSPQEAPELVFDSHSEVLASWRSPRSGGA